MLYCLCLLTYIICSLFPPLLSTCHPGDKNRLVGSCWVSGPTLFGLHMLQENFKAFNNMN